MNVTVEISEVSLASTAEGASLVVHICEDANDFTTKLIDQPQDCLDLIVLHYQADVFAIYFNFDFENQPLSKNFFKRHFIRHSELQICTYLYTKDV